MPETVIRLLQQYRHGHDGSSQRCPLLGGRADKGRALPYFRFLALSDVTRLSGYVHSRGLRGPPPGRRRLLPLDFPVTSETFPVSRKQFPVRIGRELNRKCLQHRGCLSLNTASKPQKSKIPCKIPCLQGICAETGAICTASPATETSQKI